MSSKLSHRSVRHSISVPISVNISVLLNKAALSIEEIFINDLSYLLRLAMFPQNNISEVNLSAFVYGAYGRVK